MKRNKTLSLAILSGLAVLASVPAWSLFTGYSWLTGNGNWSTAAKWSPTGVPSGAGDTATIGAAGTYTVTLDSNRSVDSVLISNASAVLALSSNTLTLLQPAGLNNSGTISSTSGSIVGPVTNNVGALISLNAGATLSLSSTSITNDGTINVNANAAGAATILTFATPASITGTGVLQMSQGGTWAQVASGVGVMVTNGASHTIKGRGNFNALLTNNGTVSADWAGDALLLRDQAKINNGLMQATLGALIIDGATVTQSASGQIVGNNNTVAIRGGASIFGGFLGSSGGGQVLFDSGDANLQNLTLSGPANIQASKTISVGAGLFANNGTVNINANLAGAPTILNFLDDITVSGTGIVQMSQQGTWAQLTSNAGKTVTNSATHTIKGRGQISAQMINNGLIHADWAGDTLRLIGQPKTNTNMMKASGGSPVLSIEGCAVTQTGAGQIFADGANIGLRSGGSISGGVLNTVGASNGFFCDSGDFTLSNLTSNGKFNIAAGRTVSVGAGLFANNGTLNVNYNQSGAATILNFTDDVAITGNGTIQMSQQGTWAQIATAVGKTITNSATQTIKGRGQITASLVNNGNVIADWANDTLILNGSNKTNNATIKSGFLSSVVSVDGCTINQGLSGQFFAESGNAAIRNNAVISGGTLNSGASFAIYADTGNATIQALTNAGKLFVAAGRTLFVGPGALVNNDTININQNQSGAATILNFLDDITVSGTGIVQMSQQGSWADVKTAAGKTVTNGASHTFKGRGQITGAFINNGLVIADWAGDTLELNGETKTNNATMKAAGGNATLSIRNCIVNQAPSAKIWAQGSNVGYRGTATINGGRLESQPTFGHYFDSGVPTLNGVVSTGSTNIAAGNQLNIGVNGFTNDGTLNVNYNQAGAATLVNIPASTTIGGSGTIQMSQQGSWAQIAVAAGQTLTHDVGHTIQGRGQVNGGVLNKGNIYANWGGDTLAINPAAPGFTNQGNMGITLATSGMTLNSANLFSNQGNVSIIAGPTLTVNGGDYSQSAGQTMVDGTLTVTGGNKVNLTGGILGGSGIVNCPVANGGTGDVSPGNSAGKLRVQGTFNQTSTGMTTIELGGTTAVTQYDVLEVTGAANLNGTLRLKIINAFVPTPATTFTVLTAGSIVGQFSNVVVEGGSVDLEASVIYTGTQVQVTFLTKVNPASFAVTGGFFAGGSLSSLYNSDNDYVYDLCDEDNSTGRIEVTSTSPIAAPTKLRFAYEAAGVRTDMVEQVEMFNYITNQWVLIPPTQVGAVNDRRLVVVVTTNPGQFVKAGTLEMKARVTWIPSLDTNAFDGWTMRIDQCAWFVGP